MAGFETVGAEDGVLDPVSELALICDEHLSISQQILLLLARDTINMIKELRKYKGEVNLGGFG